MVLERAQAYWQAKNYSGSGDWLDESGNSHDATGNGGVLFLQPDSGSQYLYLPGTNNTLLSSSSYGTGTGDWSMEADIYCNWASGAWRMLIDPPSGWYWGIKTNNTFELAANRSASTQYYNSTVAVTDLITGTQRGTVRADYDDGAQTIKFYVNGTQLGATVSTGGDLDDDSGVWTLGRAVGQNFAGRFYSVSFTESGTTRFDVDCTDRVRLKEPFSTMADQQGNTWTLNRVGSGIPATVVDQAMFVYDGTDDYHTVADHANLDFADGQDFTLVAVFRVASLGDATRAIVAKRGGYAAANAGYALYNSAFWANDINFEIADGTTEAAKESTALVDRTLAVVAARRDDATPELEVFTDGTPSGAPNTTATADLSNALALTFGRDEAPGNYYRGQIHAVALFREALTDAEIAAVGVELTGTTNTMLLLGV